ncbi:MAG: glycine C-acetyltransferase [Actinomycetota bacterium]|nr:glycine C-acetyltransferase [Actinomycetota bacterium]
MTIVVVAGTGTGVGKTWVTATLATALLHRGIAVAARKPVQSFAPDDDTPTDADALAQATGEELYAVCPRHRWLPRAMAPPMAAEALGTAAFTVAELTSEILRGVPRDSIVLVESAGGVRSPLAADGDTVSLADALQASLVILVADAELGTINLVRLSAAALGPDRVVVYLNRFDPDTELHVRNRDWLEAREGLEVVTDPEALGRVVAALATR